MGASGYGSSFVTTMGHTDGGSAATTRTQPAVWERVSQLPPVLLLLCTQCDVGHRRSGASPARVGHERSGGTTITAVTTVGAKVFGPVNSAHRAADSCNDVSIFNATPLKYVHCQTQLVCGYVTDTAEHHSLTVLRLVTVGERYTPTTHDSSSSWLTPQPISAAHPS